MTYKITFDLPNLSKGQGVAITGLGEFENGSSYEITDEQHATYRQVTSRQVDETDDKGNPTGRVLTELGPTLLQTSFQEGVTVEKSKDSQKGDDK